MLNLVMAHIQDKQLQQSFESILANVGNKVVAQVQVKENT